MQWHSDVKKVGIQISQYMVSYVCWNVVFDLKWFTFLKIKNQAQKILYNTLYDYGPSEFLHFPLQTIKTIYNLNT